MDSLTLLQNALRGSHVPELVRIHARPVLDHHRQPVIHLGDQAMVAHLTRPDGSARALRVAVSPETGREWHLRYGAMKDGLPPNVASSVPRAIDVIPGGLKLGSISYPAVLLEWVDGPTVLVAADRAARAGKSAVLRALAQALKDLWETFRDAGAVHGDLAPDNLIVRESGELVCVDLDALTWPGSPLGVTGHTTPAYRYPGQQLTGPGRDAFATLVQYVSLMVLADDPDLRRSYGDPVSTHGGALLFSSWDLADPQTSTLFTEILDRVTPDTLGLVDHLRNASAGDDRRVQHIAAMALGLEAERHEPRGEETQETSSWDLSGAIERLRSQYGDAQESEREPELAAKPPQDDGEGWPEMAPESVEAAPEDRQRLREALDSGNEAEILHWAIRLADDPAGQVARLDVERVLAKGYRDRIVQASEQRRDDIVVAQASEATARNIPLDSATRKIVRRARERLEVRAKLDRALASNDRSTLADLAVSGELVVLGDTDRSSLQRVLQALEWPGLQRALETDDDALILSWYDPELFDEVASLPEAIRHRVILAEQRTAWVDDVRRALKRRNARELGAIFVHEPTGGADRLSRAERDRCLRMLERQSALDDLQRAMNAGDDTAILTALHTIEQVGARIEDRFTWSAVKSVMERATVIENIMAAAMAEPVDDRQLAHLLPVAKTMGLMHDAALQGDLAFDRLQALVLRGAAVRRIRRALASGDDRAVRGAAYPDVSGALDALTDDERARVEAARAQTNPRRAAS